MKTHVQQHYVPQFYLKRFSIRRKSGFKIRCFNKETEKTYMANITQVGMENYFYDKRAPPKIENLFSKKEEEHSAIYHKIVENKSIKNLSSSEKYSICEYIFYQNERTRSSRERNRQVVRAVYEKLESEGYRPFKDFPPEYQEWLLESRAEMAQINILFNEFVDDNGDIQSPVEIIQYITDLGWCLTKNDLSMEFYSSDHPIVIYNPIYKGNEIIGFGSVSYRAEGVEIYFPLEPRLCLILYDKKRSEYRKVKPERLVIKGELDWLNTQIIAMAHRTVFTKTNDFQFVKNRLTEYPELKNPNRNRIFEYDLDDFSLD